MTADIVLWLDLAEANQQDEISVRDSVPDGAEILRLTNEDVPPCPAGSPARWRPVLDGIDRLMVRAGEHERRANGGHYWVTGRAGLPAFFYLGHRLGKLAAVTFVHQARNGHPVAVLPLGDPDPAGDPPPAAYFTRSPLPRSESSGPVALVISSGLRPPESEIEDALARRPAAIVRAHAEARLDRGAVPSALRALDEQIREICAAHPARETLAVFIAGPASLAFLVGNAINPRVCRDVQVFAYDGKRYELAYELPYPPVPERNVALWLGASPDCTLDLDEEIRAIARGCGAGAGRLPIVAIPRAQPMDLLRELQERRPGMIQFSGHGSSGALVFQNDQGGQRPLPVADLVELLRLAGDPVRLAVIAACYSDTYASALLAHVDCVIVMRGRVDDTDARKFAVELYRSLADGEPVQVAFDRALLVMRLERPASDPARTAVDEAPQIKERIPGRASDLFLVRRP